MKLWGALVLTLGSGWLGIRSALALRGKARDLRDLAQSMELLRICLERFCLSTGELVQQLSCSASGAGAALFIRLERELAQKDERSVRQRWEAAIEPLDPESRYALRELGAVLGRFGASEQAAAALRAREELERMARRAEERSAVCGKLCVALGFSAGAILSLVMV